MQLLRERVRHVHAIAFTHSHADHLFGLDDARLFPRWIGGPVPVYCEQETEETIRRVFSYAFRPGTEQWPAGFRPQAPVRPDRARRAVRGPGPERSADPARTRAVSGPGFSRRLAGLLHRCQQDSRCQPAAARGLDVLVLDALRYEPHPTHLSLSEALAVIESLKPGRTFLTHLSHSFDHGPTQAALPPRVALAYDGLQVEF